MRRAGAATFATIVACTGPSHALDRLFFDQLIFQAAREGGKRSIGSFAESIPSLADRQAAKAALWARSTPINTP